MNPRRLYRCRHDRLLAGVAGGIAEYLEVDPTVVRVLWILSAFLGGFTILLYIILVFIMPLEPLTGPVPGGWTGPAGPVPGGWAGPVGPATGDPAGAGASADPAGAGATGDPATAGATNADAQATTTGWYNPSGWSTMGQAGPAGWVPGGWAAHYHEAPGSDRGNGRAGLLIGVALVVFGAIALLGALIPAWAAIGLGPAFVLALGVALVIASSRRPASES